MNDLVDLATHPTAEPVCEFCDTEHPGWHRWDCPNLPEAEPSAEPEHKPLMFAFFRGCKPQGWRGGVVMK